jgi:predicted O-methyltransferase YrrM
MILPTGNAALDAYLKSGYADVRGMSSAFAASIAGHLMRRQGEMGIKGHVAEIGTFQGRFFIALALGLQPGEKAVGIDVFTWPSEKVLDQLHANCARFGLGPERYVAIKGDASAMKPADVVAPVGGGMVRLFHIDGEHDDAHVRSDLDLAAPLMHEKGLIILDDMLHPSYPELTVSVHRWLRENRDWRALAIIDREDIVAAAKYVLCRRSALADYEGELLLTFAAKVFAPGSDVIGDFTMVLTPEPKLAAVD